jgi:hypothetical protein
MQMDGLSEGWITIRADDVSKRGKRLRKREQRQGVGGHGLSVIFIFGPTIILVSSQQRTQYYAGFLNT